MSFHSQMTNDWTPTYCNHEEGFSKVLHTATVRLGISGRLEYVGREYVEQDTECSEVTMYIRASDKFVEIKPWCVTATSFCLSDTYQLVARNDLKYMCQVYEWHLGPTAMMYFPPLDHKRPTWEARVQTLKNLSPRG
jgi:hypothetical protein